MRPTGICIGRAVVVAAFALVLGTSLAEAATFYLSPSGDDANNCATQATACRTLQRGYNVAVPGDTIEMATGTYAGGTLSGSKAAPGVVFRPAPGAVVAIGGPTITATNLEFRDLTITSSWSALLGSNGITFRNVKMEHFNIRSAQNLSIIGGEVTPPGPVNTDPNITEDPGSRVPPRNILIDGVSFHDWIDVGPGTVNHIECLQVGAGENVTVRNSRFWNCDTHDIFIRSWGGINNGVHSLRGWTIENNFFGETKAGFFSIQLYNDLGTGIADFLVRNNSFLQGIGIDPSSTDVTMMNNILAEQATYACGAKVYGRNIYEELVGGGSKCGATDIVTRVTYINRATLNLHLVAGSPAIDAGDATNSPATDIDGETRGVPDIGADEFRSGPPPAAPTALTVQ